MFNRGEDLDLDLPDSFESSDDADMFNDKLGDCLAMSQFTVMTVVTRQTRPKVKKKREAKEQETAWCW